jgi:hypothetical protein
VAALEDGKVLYLPRLSFDLSVEECRFLSPSVADAKHKNVSFDPRHGTVKHAVGAAAEIAAIATMMRRYSDRAVALVRFLLPHYASTLEIGRTSFRPAEVAGRRLSAKKDDTRLHIDAFPSTPMGGKRILRIFSNVNPQGGGRDWRLGAPFEAVAQTFAARIPAPLPGAARLLNLLGATKALRTPYDHLMLAIHDAMKSDDAYQGGVSQASFSFPPGSTWIVFTDKVSHAAMGGQHLLEQTLYLPVQAMADPEKSPLRILERLTQRTLV